MKVLLIVSLFLVLAGCTAAPTLEELEFAALESGDWSEVHKRERAMARRASRAAQECPIGRVRVCVRRAARNECGCVARDQFQDVFIF